MSAMPLVSTLSRKVPELRDVLETAVGDLPDVDLMASMSDLTPETFAAPIGVEGRRLPLDASAPPEYYLDLARAALALYLHQHEAGLAWQRQPFGGPTHVV